MLIKNFKICKHLPGLARQCISCLDFVQQPLSRFQSSFCCRVNLQPSRPSSVCTPSYCNVNLARRSKYCYSYTRWQSSYTRTLFVKSVFPATHDECTNRALQFPQAFSTSLALHCKDEGKGSTEDKSNSSKIKDKIGELADDIKTIPNMLTMSRVVLAPVCGYLVLQGSFNMAFGLFIFAGFTDLLDGYIARRFPSQSSVFGSVIDPLADKFLVTILTVSLTMVDLIPLALTGLIIFRDVGLIIGTGYMRYTTLPENEKISRFFDVSIQTFTVQPTAISKINTGVQLLLLASTLGAPVFGYVDHVLLQCLWYLTAATTFMSGISYVIAKDAIQVMKKN